MCGIVGYIGPREAYRICFNGLRRLEYRGYDSAGIAVLNDGGMQLTKRVGKLRYLGDALDDSPLPGPVAIGHTRYSTTGASLIRNAKPFKVTAIFHDDRCTYIRADATEVPALYELKDGAPNLVQFDYRDGVYLVGKVLDRGYLAIGRQRLAFFRQE